MFRYCALLLMTRSWVFDQMSTAFCERSSGPALETGAITMTITTGVQRTATKWTASAAARARRLARGRFAEWPQIRRQSASQRFFEQTELALRGVARTPAAPPAPPGEAQPRTDVVNS